MPASDRLVIHIRITPSLLKRVKLAAVENERSMNAELLARIERSFSTDDSAREAAAELLTQALKILDRGTTD